MNITRITTFFVSVITCGALVLAGCSRSQDAELGKARAEADAAKAELARTKAEADAAKAELARTKAEAETAKARAEVDVAYAAKAKAEADAAKARAEADAAKVGRTPPKPESLAGSESDAHPITGTWAGYNEGAPSGFDKNYTETFESSGGHLWDGKENGKWRIENGKLFIEYPKEFIGGGFTGEYSYDLRKDTLTMRQLYCIYPDGRRQYDPRPERVLQRKK